MCLFFGGVVLLKQGLCDGIYLLNGVGLPGELEIGQKIDTSSNHKGGEWIDHSSDLKFKVDVDKDKDKFVVLILCAQRGCVAERNIEVGTGKKTLLRRYGAPLEKRELKDDTIFFYRYYGVGFKIEKERVSAIYIFPRFDKKK
jgi:hypothetical protein